MLVKALVTFSGSVNMVEGETKELVDEAVIADLLNAKYIEQIGTASPETKKKKAAKAKEA